jgi:hypothetical protein
MHKWLDHWECLCLLQGQMPDSEMDSQLFDGSVKAPVSCKLVKVSCNATILDLAAGATK